MSVPLVSVLMSVHNGERYLRYAVDSILQQTFTDFEFLVVDDASTDSSAQILGSYADPRLRVIQLRENSGLAAALNTAAGEARGTYFARMDADDEALPHRLERQVGAFRLDPKLILLGSMFEFINGDGHAFGQQWVPTDDSALREHLLQRNAFAHPTVMMRADAFRAVGGYRDIGGRFAQDYDLWLRLAELGRVGNLGEVLLRYRVHEQQVSVAKLLSQRLTAELYRQLALQRRAGHTEDLNAARRAAKGQLRRLRAECAAELLTRSAQFEREGRRDEAQCAHWRAFRMAPLSGPVRNHVAMALRWRWQRFFTSLRR